MGQRNTLCTQQMLDLQLEQGVSHIPADRCILSGDVTDYTNRSIHPGLSVSGSTAEQGILSREYSDSTVYGNQYNSFQNFNAISNLGPSVAAPSNFYAPCMFPSSSSRNFPVRNNASSDPLPVTPGMDELLRYHQISESIRVFGKRKNGAMPPGNQHNINVPANSSPSSPFLSLNCGFPQWEQSYEPEANHADSTNFEHPDYQDRGCIQTAEGSHRSVRSRSSVISLQPESAYFHHPNYVLQATHLGQPLHPASNLWIAQFGPENNIVDGSCSTWSYNHPMTYLHGRCLHSGGFELINMAAMQAFPDASSSANAGAIFIPTSLPNFHQHLLPVQAMQLPSYAHQVQMQVPSYQHPLNNMHPVDVNPFGRGLNSGSRFPYFPSNSEQLFRPRRIQHTLPDLSDGGVRILSSEDATVMDISRFYGVGNAIDQHHDMRLDIDEMSYEELLALEEQIGVVKTGLTEEYIKNNLMTSVHSSQTASLQSDELSRFSQEAEACIICQVEYSDDEIIGTLDCGHNYHGECIKQWLLVKNLCPICKKAGLATDNSQG